MVEQDCAYLDTDGMDFDAHHVLGWEDGALIAYLRILAPGAVYAEPAIGRVIVSTSARGRGLGRVLMREGMQHTRALYGDIPIKLSAQAHLDRFYRSLGFEVCGEGYDEDGIPHLPMKTT